MVTILHCAKRGSSTDLSQFHLPKKQQIRQGQQQDSSPATTAKATANTRRRVRFSQMSHQVHEIPARWCFSEDELSAIYMTQDEQQQMYHEIAVQLRRFREAESQRASKQQQQQEQQQQQQLLQQERRQGNSNVVVSAEESEKDILLSKKSLSLLTDDNPDDDYDEDDDFAGLESILEQRGSDRSERMDKAVTMIVERQCFGLRVDDEAWLERHYRPLTSHAAKLARERGLRDHVAVPPSSPQAMVMAR